MLRNNLRDYEQAEKYYLKCLEIDDIDCGTVNGSYGYLLYLMGDIEKAKEKILLQLDKDKRNREENKWPWFYHGLVFDQDDKREVSLMKAFNFLRLK